MAFKNLRKAQNVKTGQQQGWVMFKAILHISKYMCVCGLCFIFLILSFFFLTFCFLLRPRTSKQWFGARSSISTTVWETTVQILLNTQISLAVFRFPETARLCQQICCYFQTYLSPHIFDKQTKYSLEEEEAPNDCHEIAETFILMIQQMTSNQCYQMLHKIITTFTLLP